MRIQKHKILIVTSIFVWAAFYGCGRTKKPDEHLASVNEIKLNSDILILKVPPEFRGAITNEQWLELVKSWIDDQILAQAAEVKGALDDPEIKYKLAEAQRRILIEYLRDKIIAPDIEINMQEIEHYYLENQGDFVRENDEVDAMHIVVSSKKTADSVKAFIKCDSSFAGIAQKFSEEYSQSDSCYLGWFIRKDLLPDLVRPVFKAKPGETIGPIKANGKYHFFLINDFQCEGSVRALDIVGEKIRQKLFTYKFNDKLNRLVDSLRAVSTITIDTTAIDSIAAVFKFSKKQSIQYSQPLDTSAADTAATVKDSSVSQDTATVIETNKTSGQTEPSDSAG